MNGCLSHTDFAVFFIIFRFIKRRLPSRVKYTIKNIEYIKCERNPEIDIFTNMA